MAPVLQSALGVSVFIALAWAVSEERRAFPWRIVLAGLALQFALAGALLKLPWIRGWVLGLNEAMLGLERATEAGTAFVFGYLGGGPLPFEEVTPGTSFVIAFRVLPLILVVSALSSLLFYWRILPFVVRVLSRILEKTLGIGGAVGLSAADGGAALGAALPRRLEPRGAVLAHELRHGHHRRDGHGPVCEHPGGGGPRGHGAHPDGLAHQHPGRAPHRRRHGAVCRTCHRGRARSRRDRTFQHGRHYQRHARRHRPSDQHRRPVGRVRGAGEPRGRHSRRPAARHRAASP